MRHISQKCQIKTGSTMACLNIYSTEQQQPGGAGLCHPSMARISFSSDFLDTQQATKHDYREAPVSSDFEFSITSNTSLTLHSSDEIFSKGMLLPLKDGRKMTLRDELLVDDDDDEDDNDDLEFGHGVLPRLPKMSSRWKERLGLRRPQAIVHKKEDDEKKIDVFVDKETIFGLKTTIKEACGLDSEEGVMNGKLE